MKKAIAVVLFGFVVFCGCSFDDGVQKAENAFNTIEQAEEAAGPLIEMLQDEIPGWDGFDEEKKLELLNKLAFVEESGNKLQAITKIIAQFTSGKVQGYVLGADKLIGLGVTLIGLIGGLVNRLKAAKTYKAVAVSAMKAGDEKAGYGSSIAESSSAAGVRAATEELYQSEVKE